MVVDCAVFIDSVLLSLFLLVFFTFLTSLFLPMRIHVTLALVASIIAAPGFAQSIDPQKISFDYVRLPLVPLPTGTHTFQSEVLIRYEEAIKQQKEAHSAAVVDAQSKATEAKKEYKAQSLGMKAFNKIVLDERKPQDAVMPRADYTPQLFDTKTLAATYVSVSGLQRTQSNDADLHVVVSLDGFT